MAQFGLVVGRSRAWGIGECVVGLQGCAWCSCSGHSLMLEEASQQHGPIQLLQHCTSPSAMCACCKVSNGCVVLSAWQRCAVPSIYEIAWEQVVGGLFCDQLVCMLAGSLINLFPHTIALLQLSRHTFLPCS